MASTTHGIHQGDLILMSALKAAFADLRKNAWLLDYAFMGLLQDDLTVKEHGQKALRDIRDWFLKTDINFYHGMGGARPQLPCVDILLQSGEETEKTLGDKHYLVDEPIGDVGPTITEPFTATSYDPLNGILVLPKVITDNVWLSTNLSVVEGNGTAHAITEINEDLSLIIAGGPADFRKATLRYNFPARVQLESVQERETYQLGVHVGGPPLYCLVLHALVKFCLWRYKQSLLEARNFSETNLSSSDFSRNGAIPFEEPAFSRYVTITGTVRQFWPKDRVQPAAQVGGSIVAIGGETVPPDFGDPDDLLWVGDEDVLDMIKSGG
jgi:hypothetical protein